MAKRWILRPKFRNRKGGLHLTVPGDKAGRPDLAEVGISLFKDEIVEGDHWEACAEYLMEVVEPAIGPVAQKIAHAGAAVVVEVAKKVIPGTMDDALLDAARPAIEKGIAEAVDKVVDAIEHKVEHKAEPDDDEGDEEHAQSNAPDGASKIKRLRKKKNSQE